RQRRVVLERTVEFGNGGERVERVLRLVVAERLDDGASEKVFAAAGLPQKRLTHPDVVAMRGERANQLGPHELALFLVERGQKLRDQRGIGVVLEEAVGGR